MDAQTITIEPDVTCLVGKNESGKTTILKALHRLKPANGNGRSFNLTTEYPRSRLARDRRQEDLDDFCPVVAWFQVEDADRAALAEAGLDLPKTAGLVLEVGRGYGGSRYLDLHVEFSELLADAASAAAVHEDDLAKIEATTATELGEECGALARQLKDDGEAARSKAIAALAREVAKFSERTGTLEGDVEEAAWALVPKFFYFSEYDTLPGICDLEELAQKVADGVALSPKDQTVLALLDCANKEPGDFLDDDFDSRKAELQAAGSDLTQKVFEYWKQNDDLTVVFDTDMPVVGTETRHPGVVVDVRHRTLHILLRDDRHGGIETNFETRSAGFQWFFSFLAAFSKYQGSKEQVIVLLDEPGTSEPIRLLLLFVSVTWLTRELSHSVVMGPAGTPSCSSTAASASGNRWISVADGASGMKTGSSVWSLMKRATWLALQVRTVAYQSPSSVVEGSGGSAGACLSRVRSLLVARMFII